jgi:hypothetical protein
MAIAAGASGNFPLMPPRCRADVREVVVRVSVGASFHRACGDVCAMCFIFSGAAQRVSSPRRHLFRCLCLVLSYYFLFLGGISICSKIKIGDLEI